MTEQGDTPWWKTAAFYQIYPRSFYDVNGDGVGDILGVSARMDYLSWLGINAIWLSPFYPSPMVDYGYDISDYTDVNPLFGTLEEFDYMLTQAHRRGIRVIIDWVPNHTSDQHSWFRESRSSRTNPKRDWYVWRDAAFDGGPPNDWMSVFRRSGPAWTWDARTSQYYLHSFSAQQPDLNWANPDMAAAMHQTLRFWLDRGVDGFRIDAIPQLGKEFVPHSCAKTGREQTSHANAHEHLRGIRRVLDEYPDRVAVGEVSIHSQKELAQYANATDGLHLAHNFVLLHQPWDAEKFRSTVNEFESLLSADAWPCWFLNNHDNPRVVTRYGANGHGKARARVAALTLLTLRGTPFLYQGEELGLADVDVPKALAMDINGRDPHRTPLPWAPPSEAGPGAGFTRGERPWLPVGNDAEQVNVATQAKDQASILRFYRRLLRTRSKSRVLQLGAYEPVETDSAVFGYIRSYGRERILVLANFSDHRIERPLAHPAAFNIDSLVMATAAERRADMNTSGLALGPEEGFVFRLK